MAEQTQAKVQVAIRIRPLLQKVVLTLDFHVFFFVLDHVLRGAWWGLYICAIHWRALNFPTRGRAGLGSA